MHKNLLSDDYHPAPQKSLYERALRDGPKRHAVPDFPVHGKTMFSQDNMYPDDMFFRSSLSGREAVLPRLERVPLSGMSGQQTFPADRPWEWREYQAGNKTSIWEAKADSSAPCRTSLQEELPSALRAYDAAVSYMRRAMTLARQGTLHFDSAEQIVRGIIESLRRNPDALVCLPKVVRRDKYFYTHNVNVCILLTAFYISMGESDSDVMAASLAGLFHDLGKAFLPKSLLASRGALTETERSLVMRHPVFGHSLLADSLGNLQPQVLLAVLEHHERYDGLGYPKGIGRNTISRIGHLTALADSYDAMTSVRSYRKAVTPHRALCTMFKLSESQFHPVFLALFVRMLGIYPVGSIVELQDGYTGVITQCNPLNALLPVVTLVKDAEGLDMPHVECDLAKDQGARIIRSMSPEESGIDPHCALGSFAFPHSRSRRRGGIRGTWGGVV